MRQGTGVFWLLMLSMTCTTASAQVQGGPYANSSIKPPVGYNGPTFVLSYDYPQKPVAPPQNPPWIQALGGKPISSDNALAYVEALKDYISEDMQTLLYDYPNWDAGKAGWYNLPWLSTIRDPIHGTYKGSGFSHNMFPLSNLSKGGMTTYVLVYYNDVAGYTLSQLWGQDAMHPDVSKAQFEEGAIIIKAAFSTATDWSPLEGAQLWEIFTNDTNPQGKPVNRKLNVSFFQFDIIVKDSKTAYNAKAKTNTQWVFSTLVYDKNVKGTNWDQMIPLGAMWGNDPSVNSAIDPNAVLQENVINPMAPLYAVETLGYGGRLSGPNDGAINTGNIVDGEYVPRMRVSSCMSCHGSAEWPMKSSLLPGPGLAIPGQSMVPDQQNNSLTYMYKPGSLDFNRWFQDRAGNDPQDAGTVAVDYDMNIAFKALPLWYLATHPAASRTELLSKIPPALHPLLLHPEQTNKAGHLFQADQ